jgi:hypothetical protein
MGSLQKKREYLDMVTNPDRFSRYKTYQSAASARVGNLGRTANMNQGPETKQPESSVTSPDQSESIDDFDHEQLHEQPMHEQSMLSPLQKEKVERPRMPEDLGVRLGMAAMVNEGNRKQAAMAAERDRIAQEKKREMERREFERKAAEIARQRQEELERREAELREKRRQEEEAMLKARAEQKKREEERIALLMQAQEEYWTKKLASERKAKAESLKQTPKTPVPGGPVKASTQLKAVSPVQEPESLSSIPSSVNGAPSSPRFNPDEKFLLEKVRKKKKPLVTLVAKFCAARASGYCYVVLWSQ